MRRLYFEVIIFRHFPQSGFFACITLSTTGTPVNYRLYNPYQLTSNYFCFLDHQDEMLSYDATGWEHNYLYWYRYWQQTLSSSWFNVQIQQLKCDCDTVFRHLLYTPPSLLGAFRKRLKWCNRKAFTLSSGDCKFESMPGVSGQPSYTGHLRASVILSMWKKAVCSFQCPAPLWCSISSWRGSCRVIGES